MPAILASARAVDAVILTGAAVAALALGIWNTTIPSLWHDELVHVYVAQNLARSGEAVLPSGMPYYNGTMFHLLLAAIIKLGGESEFALRAPSAVIAAANAVLTFFVLRPLLGRRAALVAALGMALSPWNVAWSRQARFYSLHQGFYIAFVGACWHAAQAENARRTAVFSVAAIGTFIVGVLTSFHALIFLAAPGFFAMLMALRDRRVRSRWTATVPCIGVLGLVGLALVRWLMNPVDRAAIVDNGGLGGDLTFPDQTYRLYYLNWLKLNLSTAFLILAVAGSVWMIARERLRGVYAAIAFWAPLAVLTFFIGYRWPKFLFFAYPFYIAAWSYALVQLVDWLRRPAPGWRRRLAAAAIAVFLVRSAVSGVRLIGDSVEAASGTHTTLATQHPQWRKPCQWVRQHMDSRAILTTSYLPVHYYVGRVDNWYPARALPWEAAESGLSGLQDVSELAAFVEAHPRGFFIAEWWRFERNYKDAPWADFSEDIAWVQANMRRVDEASSADVTVYAWGEDAVP
jgi:4-amino-4-deoxy-L-arabinose transferase-like glycosyltransferase